MMRAAIVDRPLDPAVLVAEVASHAHGATAVFIGTVREVNDGRAVVALEYRAYQEMAERELRCILTEAADRWMGVALVCEHRVGTLALGDAAVVVAAAHAHRADTFDACRYVIEQLKRRVPIWKREHYADGDLAWVEVHAPSAADAHR